MNIEDARLDDAKDLAFLINLAGEGIPCYLWSGLMSDQQTPLDLGAQRAMREEGAFSYRNARVVRYDSDVAGMILSYRLDDPYLIDDLESYPEVVRPLIILESKVPGSWYVNAIASNEKYRGKGVAKLLLYEAEIKAQEQGIDQICLIVASENSVAKQLYIKLGYQCKESLPVVFFPGCLHGGNWELMTKDLLNV